MERPGPLYYERSMNMNPRVDYEMTQDDLDTINEISTLTDDVGSLAHTIGELGSVVDVLLTRLQKLEQKDG